MMDNTRVFLAADTHDAAAAERTGLPCVYFCYRIAAQGTLQRALLPAAAKGGLLGVFDTAGLAECDPGRLAHELHAECTRRGYAGAVLDGTVGTAALPMLSALSQELRRAGVVHYVPAELLPAAPGARAIVSGAVSGGSFPVLLDGLCRRWGAGNIALDLQRTRSLFTMPSWSPEGKRLDAAELNALLAQQQPSIFFSDELGCKYFTFRQDGQARFVLFDDADTAAFKLNEARRRGLPAVFLLWSEWGPAAREIAAAR